MTRVVSQLGGVNLAQGMPNFPPPKALLEAAHRAIDGDFHQYAITWGTPSLRRAIADKYRAFYGMDVDPERHVTVCCGATETMLSTLLAVLNPGDEVIIFEPFYENYGPGCIISGATPVWVPLEPPDFGFDPDRLRRAVSARTKAIVFNSPNNPSGKVFSRAELATIAEVCLQHDLLAITDEIYEHIVYDGHGHTPIATLPAWPSARSRSRGSRSRTRSPAGASAMRWRRPSSRSAFGARTTSSPSARRTRCRRRRSPRCDSPSDITSSYARVTRSGATYSGATSRARASWPGSPAARTTSSPTPRTS